MNKAEELEKFVRDNPGHLVEDSRLEEIWYEGWEHYGHGDDKFQQALIELNFPYKVQHLGRKGQFSEGQSFWIFIKVDGVKFAKEGVHSSWGDNWYADDWFEPKSKRVSQTIYVRKEDV